MINRMNAMYNAKNPYQGLDKKVLCVCSAGLLRSPTAAVVLNREYGYNTRACGIHDYALIQYNEVLGHWADEIVVMNPELVIDTMPKEKTTVLNIPDIFEYMDKTLQKRIKEEYENTLRDST